MIATCISDVNNRVRRRRCGTNSLLDRPKPRLRKRPADDCNLVLCVLPWTEHHDLRGDFEMQMRALGILLAIASSGAALAQNFNDLKIGTYQTRPGGPQRVFLGEDLCRQCLSPNSEGKPAICSVVLCAPLNAEARATYRPIPIPDLAGKAARACPINALCMPDNFDNNGWPPKDVPELPVYRKTEPYKLWLEGARIQHDMQLRRGEISREDYRDFMRNYRADWKGLTGR